MTNPTPPEPERIARMVDMKVPLWGMLTAAGTAAFFIVSMWFTTNQTAAEVRDLKIDVKSGNSQTVTLAGEQALIRFRMDNVDGELRSIKNSLPGYGTNNPPNPNRRHQ